MDRLRTCKVSHTDKGSRMGTITYGDGKVAVLTKLGNIRCSNPCSLNVRQYATREARRLTMSLDDVKVNNQIVLNGSEWVVLGESREEN
jgi:hypothetical protein